MHLGIFIVFAAVVIHSAVGAEIFKLDYFLSAQKLGQETNSYCVVYTRVGDGGDWNEDKRTKPKPGTENPVWDEKFTVVHTSGEKTQTKYLKIAVFDQLITESEFIGAPEIPVLELVKNSNFQVTSSKVYYDTVKPLTGKTGATLKIHHRITEITDTRRAASARLQISRHFNAGLILVLSLSYFLGI